MCSGAQFSQLMVRTEEYLQGGCSTGRQELLQTEWDLVFLWHDCVNASICPDSGVELLCRGCFDPVQGASNLWRHAKVMCLPIEVGVRLIAICDHADTDTASREVDEG